MAAVAAARTTKTATGTPAPSQPSHPNLVKVLYGSEPYSSSAISMTNLPAGSHFTTLNPGPDSPIRVAAACDYTTVQSAALPHPTHISLNSDLVYCNHSCDPSLVFDMQRREVRVIAGRDLREGDRLTFFYPSTEWVMDQPFMCRCGFTAAPCDDKSESEHEACLGWIGGAKFLSDDVLKRYWLNPHIQELLERRAGDDDGAAAHDAIEEGRGKGAVEELHESRRLPN